MAAMTIRNKLTLIASAAFGIAFALAAVLVYAVFYDTSERIIFSELQKTSMLAAMVYLEKDELPAYEHQQVRSKFDATMFNTDVKIYDQNNRLTYGNGRLDKELTSGILERIRSEGKASTNANGHYYYGIFYPDNQGNFVIVVATTDAFLVSQSRQLLLMMVVALLLGLLIIVLLSRWLSRLAYQPVAHIIKQVNKIDIHSLDNTVTPPEPRDELHALVLTFNDLLVRLSDAFVIQRNFINYVSHEFKTPLASISGNLEVFAQKERTAQEYREVTGRVVMQVYHMEELLRNLMLLAGLREADQGNTSYRVDEMLWETLDRIYREWPNAKPLISVYMDVPSARRLTVKGNGSQMQIAVYNLMENALKYADGEPATVSLMEQDGQLTMEIQDHGRGIAENELRFIHQPFYRGNNVGQIKGSGIGLSLAVLICKQNNVSFSISSVETKGSTVHLRWPAYTVLH